MSYAQFGAGRSMVRASRCGLDRDQAGKLAGALALSGLPVTVGPVLSVSTATGTAATAKARGRRTPGAAAEGMEGYGVATAALIRGLPMLEIRAISNFVGPRDRSTWRIGEALNALSAASSQ